MSNFLRDVKAEVERARSLYPEPFHSAHEGESVLREELEEVAAWVRRKPALRSTSQMRAECVQLAAMAMRFAEDICDTGRGNVI
jgi:hypothetical protein